MFVLSKDLQSQYQYYSGADSENKTKNGQKSKPKRKDSESEHSDFELEEDLQSNPLLSDPTMQIYDVATGIIEKPLCDQRIPYIWLQDRFDRLGKEVPFGRYSEVAVTITRSHEIVIGKPWKKEVLPFEKHKQASTLVDLAEAYNCAVQDLRVVDRKLQHTEMQKVMAQKFVVAMEMEFADYVLADIMCCFTQMCDRELYECIPTIDMTTSMFQEFKESYHELLLGNQVKDSLIKTLHREIHILKEQVQSSRSGEQAAEQTEESREPSSSLGRAAGGPPQQQVLELLPGGRVHRLSLIHI